MVGRVSAPAARRVTTMQVMLPPRRLGGILAVPDIARGMVIFAHGSGSSRFSPRNARVAEMLHEARLGTLLFDLLGEGEATRDKVFDIDLLAGRLLQAITWLRREGGLGGLRAGLFGSSTGAAAALLAAARDPGIRAVVCRGGRPDLATAVLPEVTAPTLLIVGGNDDVVGALNRRALPRLGGQKRLEVVPGASHLFAEPGALDRVVELARDWFVANLCRGPAAYRRQGPPPARPS